MICRFLILAGLPTHIINIETGTAVKKIRALAARLEEDGYPVKELRPKCTRSSRSAIYSSMDSYHASLVMNLYRVYGGEEIFNSIDMPALLRAYKTYAATIENLPRSNNQFEVAVRAQKFSLANSWILANELRSGEASFEECSRCHTTYFFTQLQQVECTCPFCRQIDLQKLNKNRKKDFHEDDQSIIKELKVAVE